MGFNNLLKPSCLLSLLPRVYFQRTIEQAFCHNYHLDSWQNLADFAFTFFVHLSWWWNQLRALGNCTQLPKYVHHID